MDSKTDTERCPMCNGPTVVEVGSWAWGMQIKRYKSLACVGPLREALESAIGGCINCGGLGYEQVADVDFYGGPCCLYCTPYRLALAATGPCPHEEQLAEYERLKQELNRVLHPKGDGPVAPAFCDLVAYAEGDQERLRQTEAEWEKAREDYRTVVGRLNAQIQRGNELERRLRHVKAERDDAQRQLERLISDISREFEAHNHLWIPEWGPILRRAKEKP